MLAWEHSYGRVSVLHVTPGHADVAGGNALPPLGQLTAHLRYVLLSGDLRLHLGDAAGSRSPSGRRGDPPPGYFRRGVAVELGGLSRDCAELLPEGMNLAAQPALAHRRTGATGPDLPITPDLQKVNLMQVLVHV